MNWLLIIIAAFLLFMGFFWFLGWLSDRTYKPSKGQVRNIIESTLNDTIDLNTFDEFSCVRIAYNAELELIREKYNSIANNSEYIDREITNELVVPLSSKGKQELRNLLNDLEEIAT